MNRRGFFRSLPFVPAFAYLVPHIPNRVAPTITGIPIRFLRGDGSGMVSACIDASRIRGLLTADHIQSIYAHQIKGIIGTR